MESTSKTAVASGVISDFGRVAGNDEEVADLVGLKAQQIRLHAEEVPVAAGVMEEDLDPCSEARIEASAMGLIRALARGPSGMLTQSTP